MASSSLVLIMLLQPNYFTNSFYISNFQIYQFILKTHWHSFYRRWKHNKFRAKLAELNIYLEATQNGRHTDITHTGLCTELLYVQHFYWIYPPPLLFFLPIVEPFKVLYVVQTCHVIIYMSYTLFTLIIYLWAWNLRQTYHKYCKHPWSN